MKNKNSAAFLILLIICLSGCRKYLDAVPDKKLATATTLDALQALLDNNTVMNRNCPSLEDGSCDDYYLSDADWQSLSGNGPKNIYIWGDTLFDNGSTDHWARIYNQVYYSNTVLEGLEGIERNNAPQDWDRIKGSALFFRSRAFLQAAWTWAKAYDAGTSNTDKGIPLKTSTDYNEKTVRATVEETYDRITEDLKSALTLLPSLAETPVRPSKCACYALLSRTYLSMSDYANAKIYADSALAIKQDLLDFSTLKSSSSYPIARLNKETVFYNAENMTANIVITRARIDTTLIASYGQGDLRLQIFYKKTGDNYFYKGSYDGSSINFNGIAVDELFLIEAECNVRNGAVGVGISYLNTLLASRYDTTFKPVAVTGQAEALKVVLDERRKELVFRDLRWMDLKRLNKTETFKKTLERNLGGTRYLLLPESPRYALPIPQEIVRLSGIEQN